MNLRTPPIAILSLLATLTLAPLPAMGQSDQQCSLKTITQTLNNLGCVVTGAYIAADSVVASITDTCAPTADAETCHACFRKGGAKVGPALKALVKAKMLKRTTLSQFKIALVTAEEETCAPKETEEPNEGEDGNEGYAPPSTPTRTGENGSRGRGRDDSKNTRPERPERRR